MKRPGIFLIIVLALLTSCSQSSKKYKIGVSQCSTDIWREKQNAELRAGAYLHDDVELRFASADDSDERQVQQIDSLVATGIDLLIVSPNQVATISPAIERAHDRGIPVIVFERKTDSEKYTAFMAADNYEMGRLMGDYIAGRLGGEGRVMEVMGLQGSSSAIERHNGFADALHAYPGIEIVATLQGDWTERSAYEAVLAYEGVLTGIDFVFGQNDRMAIGVRKALAESGALSARTRFCGIDGLPGDDGGIRLVRDSILDASQIYPTRGDKLLELAMDILTGKPYEKETRLMSALVTDKNAAILLMQNEEILRQAAYLETLHDRVDAYLHQLSSQRTATMLAIGCIILLLVTIVAVYLYFHQKARLNDEREQMHRQKLDFYTQVSHELRTPLTLVQGPLAQLADTPEMKGAGEETTAMLGIVRRNAEQLSALVNKILDAQTGAPAEGMTPEQIDSLTLSQAEDASADTLQPSGDIAPAASSAASEGEQPCLLIVDDNADIRAYLRTILQGRYQVNEAADGRAGLAIAREEVPDLIISDVMMPVMNGLEFCQEVKRDVTTSHIPVILLTARALSQHQIEGYESGADAYITKPFSPKLLLARVENLLRNRHLLKDIFSKESIAVDGSLPLSDSDAAGRFDTASDLNPATGSSQVLHLSAQDAVFIDKFKTIVSARLGDSELSVEDIGAEIGMSRVQLYRKIKALTGLSPNEQLRKARLTEARRLLVEGAGSVSEIAYRVGFATPSYFSKCFKEEFGCSPGEV
ncbi:MAG: substrate-binding domain-containing protein [Prevotella sp.]|nr:substrate-binding domain-containing protein [Prevotella sp.]